MGNQSNSIKDFNTLVNDLHTDKDLFNKMGPGLSLVDPGKWDDLIKWAKHFGYTITLTDIKTYMEKNPKLNESLSKSTKKFNQWNMISLSEHLNKLNAK